MCSSDLLWADFHALCQQYEIRSAWSSPLIAARDGSLLGVFGMYHADVRPMTQDDEELVNHFADLAAMAIERHNEQALQRYQATHDVLTGLGNRRLLEEEGPRLREAALQDGDHLCAVFIDLDNFKSINDTFGHTLADEVLAKIAARMRQHFGDESLVTRFGGDEFVALCREPQNAVLERIEAAIGPNRDRIQAYCDVLELKWILSERARRDVGLVAAIEAYLEQGAPAPEGTDAGPSEETGTLELDELDEPRLGG